MTISYAITVCNELEEITKLLDFLQVRIREEDEIVIQYDEESVTDEVMDFLKLQKAMHKIPHEVMVEYLPQLLESNQVDVIFVPRVNTVEGLTQEHIQEWKWKVNEKGWVNWPDYQLRIYKRTDDVEWRNKVHETITGYDTFSNFPAQEEWSLYHPKEIKRQEKQNKFYETI